MIPHWLLDTDHAHNIERRAAYFLPVANQPADANSSQANLGNLRSQSMGGKTKAQIAEQIARENSYKTKPNIDKNYTKLFKAIKMFVFISP